MRIEKPEAREFSILTEIWARAVKATHHFLPEEYFQEIYAAMPVDYLPNVDLYAVYVQPEAAGGSMAATPDGGWFADATAWVVLGKDRIAGFIGLSHPESPDAASRVEMLFVDPACHRMGLGRALLDYVRERFSRLELDVNEQNPGAREFYERYGFKVFGRSELDGSGKPYPLLHMRLERQVRP